MLPLLHFITQSQIMRPVTDVAYELRFYDVPVAYLFCIHVLCVASCCVAVANHSYV